MVQREFFLYIKKTGRFFMASKRNQRKTRRYAEAYKDVVTLPERVLENGLRASVQIEKKTEGATR
jgi:hypothetical protein